MDSMASANAARQASRQHGQHCQHGQRQQGTRPRARSWPGAAGHALTGTYSRAQRHSDRAAASMVSMASASNAHGHGQEHPSRHSGDQRTSRRGRGHHRKRGQHGQHGQLGGQFRTPPEDLDIVKRQEKRVEWIERMKDRSV